VEPPEELLEARGRGLRARGVRLDDEDLARFAVEGEIVNGGRSLTAGAEDDVAVSGPSKTPRGLAGGGF
jgi:hypothetical protein